jgi:hypothetical protein
LLVEINKLVTEARATRQNVAEITFGIQQPARTNCAAAAWSAPHH